MGTQASVSTSFDPNVYATNMPETWRRYLNGPCAGFIDFETAQREMPWLVGASHLAFYSAEPGKVYGRRSTKEG
jgi:hypothetical protein